MRLTGLKAIGLLSFDELEIRLSPRITTIVGPNGGGKSNMGRLLRFMADAVRSCDRSGVDLDRHIGEYAVARHRGSRQLGPPELRLGITLTEPDEQALLRDFVVALCDGARASQIATANYESVTTGVEELFTGEALSSLWSGELVASHPGYTDGRWQVAFEFHHQGIRYHWDLNVRGGQIVRAHELGTTERQVALAGLIGQAGGLSTDAVPLSSILPGAGDAVASMVTEPVRAWPGRAPYRRFAASAGIGREEADRRSYGLARVLSLILDRSVRHGVVTAPLDRAQTHRWTVGVYETADLDDATPYDDPSALPLRLFRLKNGDSRGRRRYQEVQSVFRRLTGGCNMEVAMTVLGGRGASLLTDGLGPSGVSEADRLQIDVVISKSTSPLSVVEDTPAALMGSGTQEALLLADLIADTAGSVVVLDEPGTNLHPTWQATVRSLLEETHSQCVLITHSPYLVAAENQAHLCEIVRLSQAGGATRLDQLTGSDRNKQTMSKVIRAIGSNDLRSALFAAGVVIVEGETELGALPTWFRGGDASLRAGRDFDDIMFLSAGGDRGFGTIVGFLESFQIPWAVVCDGAAFDTSRVDHVLEQVTRAIGMAAGANRRGHGRASEGAPAPMDEASFRRMVASGQMGGIFTLAETWIVDKNQHPSPESFEAYIERALPGIRGKAMSEVGSSRARQGRWIAEHAPPPEEISALRASIVQRFGRS